MLEGLAGDIRYTIRSLRRSPGFAAVAVLTLGLGIGANTAIFSVVNGVLLRPLPYADAGRLVLIEHNLTNTNVGTAPLSAPDFLDYEANAELFEGMVATFATGTNIAGDGEAEAIVLSWVTPNFFELLGVTPALGRGFRPDDEIILDPRLFQDPNATPPPLRAVLSYGLWQRRYGGDPSILDRTLRVNGQNMTVSGIAPQGFELLLSADVTIPTNIDVWTVWPFLRSMNRAPSGIITTIARMKPDVTIEQARAELGGILSDIRSRSQRHEAVGTEVTINPLHQEVVGHIKPMLAIVMGAVSFVMLIACANVANLLLVKASTREKEIAIRCALGSGQAPIVRQMLTESLTLAFLGALVGLALAKVGVDVLLVLQPDTIPLVNQIGVDGSVLLFTLAASGVAALLFGLAPVAQSARGDVALVMRERADSSRRGRLRGAIIVVEVAVSVVLLVGAGLMLRTFAALSNVEPGFDAEHVTTVGVAMPVFAYRQGAERTEFLQRLTVRLKELPGVEGVGGVYPLPLAENSRAARGPYAIQSGDTDSWEESEAGYRGTLPGYFETMNIAVLAGRTFDEQDMLPDAPAVAVIDRTMAERNWPDEDPVGRQFYIQPPANFEEASQSAIRIIGVVENVRHASLSGFDRETIYFTHRSNPGDLMQLTLKTVGNPTSLAAGIRQEVAAIDPTVPIIDIRAMDAYVSDSLAPTRFVLVILGGFALIAVLLAAIGLYGVISFSIRQRTHEIGVRVALGARRAGILRLVLAHGLSLTLVGFGLGVAGAVALNRVLAGMLYGVAATDPLTYAGIAAVLALVSSAACYVPAERAARVNPMVALRSE